MLACALALPFAIAVRGENLTALLAAGAVSSVGQGALVALIAMLIQSVTPELMRARLMALFFLILNLLGAGLSPSAVAWLSVELFEGPRALGDGLAVVAACGAGAGLLFLLTAAAWSRKLVFPAS